MPLRAHGATLLVGILAALPGCRQENPEWMGPAWVSNSGVSEADDGGSVGETVDDDGSDTASPACNHPGALGTAECPAECAECSAGVCTIACLDGDCRNGVTACPAGWGCQVDCLGRNSCRDGTIACPPDGACTVACSERDACRSVTVTCGDAPCTLTCADDHSNVCDGATLVCGDSDSRVLCQQPLPDLELVPGSGGCACEGQDCA